MAYAYAMSGDTNKPAITVWLLLISSESRTKMNNTERICIVTGHFRLLYGPLVKPVIVIGYCSVCDSHDLSMFRDLNGKIRIKIKKWHFKSAFYFINKLRVRCYESEILFMAHFFMFIH